MFDQDNNFYLINLSILVTCLLDNVWILQGEVTHQSLLGVKGLIIIVYLIYIIFSSNAEPRLCFPQPASLVCESMLSLTSQRIGEWFKEEIRVLQGLDHIMNTG